MFVRYDDYTEDLFIAAAKQNSLYVDFSTNGTVFTERTAIPELMLKNAVPEWRGGISDCRGKGSRVKRNFAKRRLNQWRLSENS